MGKMHLGARAPSEGARRLAQWIARETLGSLTVAAKIIALPATELQRMIDGDLVPGDEIGAALWGRLKLDRLEFQRPAVAGWFDAPERVRGA